MKRFILFIVVFGYISGYGQLPPRMTQSERNMIPSVAGLIIFNTTTAKPNYHNGTEWVNFDGTPIELIIGDYYQGGVVFYLDGTGGGLVCAPSDQSTSIPWCNSYVTTGATATAIGTGQANTTAIINSQGAGSYAAQVCNDYDDGTYSDWFLPSKDELNEMYQNKATIDSTAIANGGSGFATSYYWSSTEHSNYFYAWQQYFGTGFQDYTTKLTVFYVRAIRDF